MSPAIAGLTPPEPVAQPASEPRRMRPRDGSCVLTINAACASLVEGTYCEVGGGYGLAA
jgi:hypothetical protein